MILVLPTNLLGTSLGPCTHPTTMQKAKSWEKTEAKSLTTQDYHRDIPDLTPWKHLQSTQSWGLSLSWLRTLQREAVRIKPSAAARVPQADTLSTQAAYFYSASHPESAWTLPDTCRCTTRRCLHKGAHSRGLQLGRRLSLRRVQRLEQSHQHKVSCVAPGQSVHRDLWTWVPPE